MNNLSSKSKSGIARTSTSHNVTLGKKQLPRALENTRTVGAADKEEGSKLKEKEKRSPMESASARVLKKTYEKHLTCGNGLLEEEIRAKQKRKDIASISNDKELKKKKRFSMCLVLSFDNSKWLLLPLFHCWVLVCCFSLNCFFKYVL
jgi:hypothetical protein